MDALILSCSTGGGHNAAANAVREAMERLGHHATVMDLYRLAGHDLDRKVGNSYVKIAQRTPRLFGVIYKLGDEVRKIPGHSPVYAINKPMRKKVQAFLETHRYDVVLMTHPFPGEILAYAKKKGVPVPPRIYIATDYVCTPFTEETGCEAYITPAQVLNRDFIRRGIPEERLFPAGIPVRQAFSQAISREEAIAALGLDPGKRYLLLSGGSIGGGLIQRTMAVLSSYMEAHPDSHLIVICGNNRRLLETAQALYGEDPHVTLLGTTDRMALYMKSSDAFLSKPGGLSSTEAAVSGTPLIHISPIPGCENMNMSFFQSHGMSLAAGDQLDRLPKMLDSLRDPAVVSRMQTNQRAYTNPHAAEDICHLAERMAGAADDPSAGV